MILYKTESQKCEI